MHGPPPPASSQNKCAGWSVSLDGSVYPTPKFLFIRVPRQCKGQLCREKRTGMVSPNHWARQKTGHTAAGPRITTRRRGATAPRTQVPLPRGTHGWRGRRPGSTGAQSLGQSCGEDGVHLPPADEEGGEDTGRDESDDTQLGTSDWYLGTLARQAYGMRKQHARIASARTKSVTGTHACVT